MIENFVFQNTTKVYFGKGQIRNLSREAANYGKKVLVVYGGGSIKRNGIYDAVMSELKEAAEQEKNK